MITLIVKKKSIIITSSLCVLILVGVLWFQASKKTTFGQLLHQNISENEEIDRIVLQNRLDLSGGSLWAVIYDQELIDSLLTELSSVSISKQNKNRYGILNNTISIHTRSRSHVFNFENNYFRGYGKDYTIESESFSTIINNITDQVDWQTDEEFMEVEQ